MRKVDLRSSNCNICKERKDLSLMDKITEIRIDEIFDEENNQHYWIYYYKMKSVKLLQIFGVKPQC